MKVNELSKVMGNVLIPRNKVKGVITRGEKMTSEATPSKEVNETGINKNKPVRFEQDVQDMPHDDALVQMPRYAKYLKSLLTNKSRLKEACTVTMNERCLAVLLNKLPSKEKDPGSFTIPCQVSHLQINNALVDLGASIILMPYTMYEKLGLGEPKLTRMSLELVDRSIQYPRGIVENVLIKVDKFFLPIDFVILDMPENSRISIILGRPFLAIGRAMIDVFNKKITLKVGDDEVIFDMDQSMKRPPTEDDECYGIDDLDDTINIETLELLEKDQLDSFLLTDLEKSINRSDLESCNSIGDKFFNNSDVEMSIWRIDRVNTPYSEVQETKGTDRVKNKHLYLASANEIDEKKPELKDLPSHLEYAYLHGNKSFPIYISSNLSEEEKISLLQVLEKRKGAISWKMSDIKGISPSFCTYKIFMEDDFKPVIQPQRYLIPKVQDVVKNKIVKLLDSRLIYPISDSSWVSPIHIVPKKGGMTVVLNDNNELIPSRTVIGWRVCIEYHKLNDAT
ncbi:DNA-directed DNA polymerase [Tanacetum coccineum]|uniref:DNA-directed DNA polymerase n=1 Tax=Tanacetum coccineum TaxID=301880 RepID=A0ABQ4XNJ3_9ASTR